MSIALVDVYDGTRIREGALEFLYRLMQERATEPDINISHRVLPTFEQHRAYWTRRPYRFAYLIEAAPQEPRQGIGGPMPFEPTRVGYISATPKNEIGVVLLREYRGRSIGPQAVLALLARHKPNPAIPGECNGHWLANIAPRNEASQRMFTKLGFREIQRTYELNEEENHGNQAGS